jgi:hypothetical protein
MGSVRDVVSSDGALAATAGRACRDVNVRHVVSGDGELAATAGRACPDVNVRHVVSGDGALAATAGRAFDEDVRDVVWLAGSRRRWVTTPGVSRRERAGRGEG